MKKIIPYLLCLSIIIFSKCTISTNNSAENKPMDLKKEFEKRILNLYQNNEKVYDIDSNCYHTLAIGTQTWMVENLKVKHYRNGEPIPNLKNDKDWFGTDQGAFCFYNNDSLNSFCYGALYNYYCVSDKRNICPIGWQIPSNKEWKILINQMGGEAIAGKKLRSNFGWTDSNPDTTIENTFLALAAGTRSNEQDLFFDVNIEGYYRSSDADGEKDAFFCLLYNTSDKVSLVSNSKTNGMSVRCIKDK